jgi:hypothetical protein
VHYHHKSNADNSPSLFLPSGTVFIPAAVYITGLNDNSLAKAFETGLPLITEDQGRFSSQGLN